MKAARATELRRDPTPAEVALWDAMRRADLRFNRQFFIEGFIVDFVCRSAHMVVEVDGDIHDDQADYDAARDDVLRAAEFRVLRFRNERVLADPDGVAAELKRELEFPFSAP